MKSELELFKMKMGEEYRYTTEFLNKCYILRVPGGWIYSLCDIKNKFLSSTFIYEPRNT